MVETFSTSAVIIKLYVTIFALLSVHSKLSLSSWTLNCSVSLSSLAVKLMMEMDWIRLLEGIIIFNGKLGRVYLILIEFSLGFG